MEYKIRILWQADSGRNIVKVSIYSGVNGIRARSCDRPGKRTLSSLFFVNSIDENFRVVTR